MIDNCHIFYTLSQVFSVTYENCRTIKVTRKGKKYAPLIALCVKNFRWNAFKNETETPVFQTQDAAEAVINSLT